MRVSAEGFWLVNFAMDLLVLYIACRGTWFMRAGRLALASALGATYALTSALLKLPAWVDALALIAIMLAAFPARDAREFIKTASLAALMAMCLSSLMRACLLKGGGTLASGLAGVLAGALAATAFRRQAARSLARVDVRIRARAGGARAEFTALVDTGNLLTEPLSALPVLIADEYALGGAFARAGGGPERHVEYGSVGGNGKLRCLRPDSMLLFDGRRWVRAPEMWLGLYPGRMNKGIHALAPGAVLEALRRKS